MKNKKDKVAVSIFIISAVCIVVGFAATRWYCDRESSELRTYEFTKELKDTSIDNLSLSVSVSKQWVDDELHPENPVGAQYDGVLNNDSKLFFKDWSVELTFSDEMTIDSSWNGDFIENDKVIIFTAKETPATVEPNDVATFGAVMYSDQLAEVESFKLSGYRILKAERLLIFKVLVVLELVWVMTFIIWFVIHIREAAFNRRHELDKKIITQAMNTLIGFVDAKDEYTRGHSARVAEYAAEIGRRMKLSDDEVTKLYYISLMHDCGKIAVPDAVLKKPDKLNNEEFAQIKAHTTKGDKLLEDFTAIPGIREGAHFHHERYDGNGYPAQLKGEKIPLFARIICVADSYDAMSTDRCYRPHLDKEDILRELKQNAGKQFDPEIVPYMIELIEDGFADKVHTKKY